MRRPFVIPTAALALALVPAVLAAQTPPAQQPTAQPPATQQPTTQPPTTQPPATPPATPAEPSEPKLGFTAPAGLLLIQIKPDQTAAFEELSTKLTAAVATMTDPALKERVSAWKVYKSSDPMQGNALYVVLVDPAKAGAEYNPIDILFNSMTDEQKRAPETQEMFKRFAAAFSGINKLNLTPVSGGGM
jgi:hypothetical protein